MNERLLRYRGNSPLTPRSNNNCQLDGENAVGERRDVKRETAMMSFLWEAGGREEGV